MLDSLQVPQIKCAPPLDAGACAAEAVQSIQITSTPASLVGLFPRIASAAVSSEAAMGSPYYAGLNLGLRLKLRPRAA